MGSTFKPLYGERRRISQNGMLYGRAVRPTLYANLIDGGLLNSSDEWIWHIIELIPLPVATYTFTLRATLFALAVDGRGELHHAYKAVHALHGGRHTRLMLTVDMLEGNNSVTLRRALQITSRAADTAQHARLLHGTSLQATRDDAA